MQFRFSHSLHNAFWRLTSLFPIPLHLALTYHARNCEMSLFLGSIYGTSIVALVFNIRPCFE